MQQRMGEDVMRPDVSPGGRKCLLLLSLFILNMLGTFFFVWCKSSCYAFDVQHIREKSNMRCDAFEHNETHTQYIKRNIMRVKLDKCRCIRLKYFICKVWWLVPKWNYIFSSFWFACTCIIVLFCCIVTVFIDITAVQPDFWNLELGL